MIVRILGEGQFELDDATAASLDSLDKKIADAIESGDQAALRDVLERSATTVHTKGTAIAADRFVPSELTLPNATATLAELRELLASEDVGES
jgi:hypothetical protein